MSGSEVWFPGCILYCTVCGHEREFDVTKPPFDHLPDSTVVPTLGQSMVCSKCGTKGKIWSVPEFHGRRYFEAMARSGLRTE